jgi:exonuclease 3'-5' domain-containing protein 1
MYMDIEGVNLCRESTLSILTILSNTGILLGRACQIDVHTLGVQAVETVGAKGKTLKEILPDEDVKKAVLDVRKDSGALFVYFGVALQGVEVVQFMESATRKTIASRKFLSGPGQMC